MEDENEEEAETGMNVDVEDFNENDSVYDDEEIIKKIENKQIQFLMDILKDYYEKKLTPYYRSGYSRDTAIISEQISYKIVHSNFDTLISSSKHPFVLFICTEELEECEDIKSSLQELEKHLSSLGNALIIQNILN